jgi:biopolymer transport protein ExbB/TolQ
MMIVLAIAIFAVAVGLIVAGITEWLDRRRNKIAIGIKQQDLDIAAWCSELQRGENQS